MADDILDSLEDEPATDYSSPKPDDGSDATDDESTIAQIKSLQKQLNDTKAAYTQSRMEIAELRGAVNARPSAETPEVKDWVDELSDENVEQNLPSTLKDVVRNLRSEVAEVMKARDAYYSQQLEKADPERFALRERIEALKKEDDFADLPEEVLVRLAKRQQKIEQKREESAPGKIGGRRSGGKSSDSDDPRNTPLFKKIYGDAFPDLKG